MKNEKEVITLNITEQTQHLLYLSTVDTYENS